MNESLRRLQAEKRCIKSDPVEYALKVQAAKQQKERDDKLDAVLKSDKPMAEVVRDIEEVTNYNDKQKNLVSKIIISLTP